MRSLSLRDGKVISRFNGQLLGQVQRDQGGNYLVNFKNKVFWDARALAELAKLLTELN